jgi:two-component system cell cycle response regulator DivK
MPYKILVIEDNSLNLKLFTDLLSLRKYEVIKSSDGIDILNIVLSLDMKPELILMDIQLRGVSGIDLIREFKNNIYTKHIPIIAITAFTLSRDVEQIMQSGCDKYIAKPVAMEDFYSAIEEFLPVQTIIN